MIRDRISVLHPLLLPLLLSLLLPFLILLAAAGPAAAGVLRVPSELPDIQAAVDAAPAGDTVLVAPGVYTGYRNTDVRFRGRDVVVRSEEGAERTTINGSEGSEGWDIYHAETRGTVIEGLSFVRMVAGFTTGGGLWINAASPTIRNCVFAWDGAVGVVVGVGGAISIGGASASPLIEGCTITACDAMFAGDGIACSGGTVEVRNSILWGDCGTDVFTWNSALVRLTCCVYGHLGGYGGQVELNESVQADPLFCGAGACAPYDSAGASVFRLSIDSPCLPQNNGCGVLLGALGVGCPTASIGPGATAAAPALRVSPNPLTPATSVLECALGLHTSGPVRASIVDASGRMVLALEDRRAQPGANVLSWRMPQGPRRIPSGAYRLVLTTEEGMFGQGIRVIR